MKLSLASLLLVASSAFAAPSTTKPGEPLQVHNLTATAYDGNPTASMSFVVTDPGYIGSPSHCRLIWNYGEVPEGRPYCSRGGYYVHFPQGGVDFNRFTLELERATGLFGNTGQAVLDSNQNGTAPQTKWHCKRHPVTGQQLGCAHNGVLQMTPKGPSKTQ